MRNVWKAVRLAMAVAVVMTIWPSRAVALEKLCDPAYEDCRAPLLSFIFRAMRTIPIAPAKEDEALLNAAYEEVAKALERGELVAIFPEGRITDTGELYPFRGGIKRIIDRTPVPVIPLALKGLWGSFFSRIDGKAMSQPTRIIRRAFSRVELEASAPWAPAAVTPEGLQSEVQRMRGDWK